MSSTIAGAALSAAGVSFVYPGTRALDDVSFATEAGSVTALVGPNGAGKTTLLRCLAGLERPLAGRITIAGIDVLEEPRAAHAHLGFLSDSFGLYGALSVRQCLHHAASAQGVPAAQVAGVVTTTATRLGLAERLDSRCAELSRGMRQRVAIGQAIVHAPRVLLLDEPASGLDPEARHALALFTRLRDDGMTLVVSSHILAELDEYSTHMLVLRAGRVVEHRALDATAGGGTHVRLKLAANDPGWRERIGGVLGVQVLEADAAGALLHVAGEGRELARVLRELVLAGVPVAEFAAESENLHQSYLRTVRAAAAPEPRS